MFRLVLKLRIILFLLPVLTLACDEDPVVVDDVVNTVTRTIPDYGYVQRQFFYLETPGDDFNSPAPGFGMYFPVIGGPRGDSLEVFISLDIETEWNFVPYNTYYVEARTDPDNDGDLNDGDDFRSWFYMLIEHYNYDLIKVPYSSDMDPEYIGIRLKEPLPANRALAVRYKMDAGYDVITVGDYGRFPAMPIDTVHVPEPEFWITAELICPPEEDFAPPSVEGAKYESTWYMMFRNVYAFDFSGIDLETMKVEIERVSTIVGDPAVDPYSKEKYLRLFGLDNYRLTGLWGPDGMVDLRPGVIDLDNGYLMMPCWTPFNVSREELRYFFSEGPPGYWIGDSLGTVVDSISANLMRNNWIYEEIMDWNSPPHIYDIVIETTIE